MWASYLGCLLGSTFESESNNLRFKFLVWQKWVSFNLIAKMYNIILCVFYVILLKICSKATFDIYIKVGVDCCHYIGVYMFWNHLDNFLRFIQKKGNNKNKIRIFFMRSLCNGNVGDTNRHVSLSTRFSAQMVSSKSHICHTAILT